MTVDEAVRNLGKCIQEDCRYKRYVEAKKANDENETLQKQIGDFQIGRMNYQRESKKSDCDKKKLEIWEKQLEEQYDEIIASEGMKEFQEAKLELDAMMREIDTIISLCLSGEDPDTCHTSVSGCTGNCASCSAGCE